MKKKNTKILILILLVMFLTGCTKILKDEDGKTVTNKKTGQNITENIFCQPTNKDVKKIYKENKIDITVLPKCDEFKITDGGYEGLWTTVFVKPLAWFILLVNNVVRNPGLAVMIAGILLRLAMFPVTKKTASQSENMKKAAPDIEKIDKKYKGKTDQQSMMMASQEKLMIYKKYNISPLSGCLFAILQLPIFFAFYEAINRVPAIFEKNFLGLQLGTTPVVGIGNGNFLYIIVILLIVATTYYSMNNNAKGDGDQAKQMQSMTKFMVVFIFVASLFLPAATALYWISSSTFTIVQNIIVKKGSVGNGKI